MRLVPIASVQPSTYNPRKSDADRLDMVRLSLQKLGFLLPIYATPTGEIISGHQRHYVADQMGVKRVPVAYIERSMTLDDRKALNIVFNRATNDMDRESTTATVSRELALSDARALAAELDDIPLDKPEFCRCMHAVNYPTMPLVRANARRWIQYARNVSRTLHFRGIVMPIVVDPDNQVVNGIGRLQVLAEQKTGSVDVVRVSAKEAAFARAVLNYLSMDFNIHERYADVLRYNSFRRAVSNRPGLGKGFYVAHFGNVATKVFSLSNPGTLAKWRAVYGSRVLDFGAGRFTDTALLRSAGIDVTPFEPYPLQGNEIDIPRARHVAREFIDTIARGDRWKTIFVSSVFNSVPFAADRAHIACLCAALAGPETRVHIWTMSPKQANMKAIDNDALNQKMALGIQFKLNYEPNTILGSFGSKPKVQKFHTAPELRAILDPSFADVQIRHMHDSFMCVCSRPRWTPDRLAQAIAFEFDLPYPDDTRMDLVTEAKEAFSKRLNTTLP